MQLEAGDRVRQDAPVAAGHASANRIGLSIVDVTFALFALIPPLVFGGQLLNSDGDAARHIRMGELILRNGLAVTDPFSFTRPGEPILLTEWGSRVAYALAHRLAGLAGVSLLAGLIIGAAVGIVVYFLRCRKVDPLLAYLTGIAIAFLSVVHWLARPHLFTFVGLALLLFLFEPGQRSRRYWPYPLLFCVWANLHGGFVLGLVLIGVYLVGSLGEAWLREDTRVQWLDRSKMYAIALLLATAGALANPQGPVLFVHVAELLGDTELTSATFEFMSPNFHEFYGKVFLVALGLVVATLSVSGERPTLPRLGTILLLFAGALIARRNIPVFGFVVLPLLALHADALWRSIPIARLRHVRRVFEEGETAAAPGRWVAVVALIFALLGGTRGTVAGVELVPDRFDPEIFPVAAVEHARSAGINGRVFNYFTWGGYMVYAWPEQKIFIDGMTDYHGAELLNDYRTIYRLEAGWWARLREWDIDLVLVQPKSQLDYQLRREREWTVRYEDDVAVLHERVAPWPEAAVQQEPHSRP